MQSLPQQDGLYGAWKLTTDLTPLNEQVYLIERMLARVNTATLVRVVAVHPGDDNAAGTVDVLPLVSMVDGAGAPTRHATVYGLPYAQMQGGGYAFVCQPVAGDVGICLFADSDISAVKSSLKETTPGSQRKFSMSDGVYLMGWNPTAAPTVCVKVDAGGVKIIGDTDSNGHINTTSVFKVNGYQVVGPRQEAISPATGGTTIDAEVRAVVQSILVLLHNHGLMR